MMTYQAGLSKPEVFAGLFALSARIEEREALFSRLPEERNQPIFIAHGVYDPLISVDAGRESRESLVEAGYDPVYREYPMAHQICEQEIGDLSDWARGVLAEEGG